MRLIGKNGEILAEWTPNGTKRNLYCSGGFGLMLTKKALQRCLSADDESTPDMFEEKNEKEEVAAEKSVETESVSKENFNEFFKYCLGGIYG